MKRVAGLVLVGIALVALAAWLTLGPAKRIPSSDADDPPVAATLPDRHPEYPDAALEAQLRAIMSGAPARCGVVAKHLGNGAVARVNADDAHSLC